DGVVEQRVAHPGGGELAGQPTVAVEIDLHPERQPGGCAHVYQAQPLVQEIEVVVQTTATAHEDLCVTVWPGVAGGVDLGGFLVSGDIREGPRGAVARV